jgi:hypothetical protein
VVVVNDKPGVLRPQSEVFCQHFGEDACVFLGPVRCSKPLSHAVAGVRDDLACRGREAYGERSDVR